jgi:hypothetical protein
MNDPAESPGELSVNSSDYEKTIKEIVDTLIAERGYDAVICELVSSVYKLAQTCIADPENKANEREFSAWAKVVRSAIQEYEGDKAFETSVTDPDRWFAQQLGISLD